MNRLEFAAAMQMNSLPRPMRKVPEVTAASALTALGMDPELERYMKNEGEIELPQRFTKNGRKRAIPFSLKLMKVLSIKSYSHIITWMPNGKSFVIIRPKAFVNEILPKYFKSAQYASFTRKLHRWGFERVDDGAGEFFHPEFRRGRLDLAEKMTCLSEEPTKAKMAMKKAKRDAASTTTTTTTKARPNTVTSAQKIGLPKSLPGNETDSPIKKEPYVSMESMRLRESIEAAAASRAALAALRQPMHPGSLSPEYILASKQQALMMEYERQNRMMMAMRLCLNNAILRDDRSFFLQRELPGANIPGAKTA